MADPVSAASGILTLVVFAFQSSNYLYEAVSSFRSNQRTVRELREELEALNEVLESLKQTAASAGVDFTSLKLPLRRCGKACEEFKREIDKCTEHSGGSRTSFRDWAKLRYMGDDITGFKNVLASYKSTIIIALGDANV
jgi:Fungal N-terminal domain of STAND proteins